jgi:hypothetical protein
LNKDFMLTVTLYMRENCPLCVEAETNLAELKGKYPHHLIQIDVEKEGLAEYIDKIPVLEIGPYKLTAPVDKKKLEMTLGASQDRLAQIDEIGVKKHQKKINRGIRISFADKLFYWLSNRYMIVFNGSVLLFVGLAFWPRYYNITEI